MFTQLMDIANRKNHPNRSSKPEIPLFNGNLKLSMSSLNSQKHRAQMNTIKRNVWELQRLINSMVSLSNGTMENRFRNIFEHFFSISLVVATYTWNVFRIWIFEPLKSSQPGKARKSNMIISIDSSRCERAFQEIWPPILRRLNRRA